MAQGPKKHLKRVYAPKHWMLSKLTGVWAPRPSSGPHKLRECLPLIIMLRNKLKYALTYQEVKMILMQRQIKVIHIFFTRYECVLTSSSLVSSVFSHLLHSLRVCFQMFSTRFECGFRLTARSVPTWVFPRVLWTLFPLRGPMTISGCCWIPRADL